MRIYSLQIEGCFLIHEPTFSANQNTCKSIAETNQFINCKTKIYSSTQLLMCIVFGYFYVSLGFFCWNLSALRYSEWLYCVGRAYVAYYLLSDYTAMFSRIMCLISPSSSIVFSNFLIVYVPTNLWHKILGQILSNDCLGHWDLVCNERGRVIII